MAAKKKAAKKHAAKKHHTGGTMVVVSPAKNKPAKSRGRRGSNPPGGTQKKTKKRRRNGDGGALTAKSLMAQATPVAKGAGGLATAIALTTLGQRTVAKLAENPRASGVGIPLVTAVIFWKGLKQKEMALGAAAAAVLPFMSTILDAITPKVAPAAHATLGYGQNPPSARALHLLRDPVPFPRQRVA